MRFTLPATVLYGNCLTELHHVNAGTVQTCITSPPYYDVRLYEIPATKWPEMYYAPIAGVPAVRVAEMVSCLGNEPSVSDYIGHLVAVFREVRRTLRSDGTLWLNLGDNYGPGKQLRGVPWRTALALQADGWILRSENIWHKLNPMTESVKDRTTRSHEHVFMLSKNPKYYYDAEAVREPVTNTRKPGRKITDTRETHGMGGGNSGINGFMARYHNGEAPTHRNRRSVWTLPVPSKRGNHFAVFPDNLVLPCVLSSSKAGTTVLDPFSGSGTVGRVALANGRRYIGIDLNPEYVAESRGNLIG